MSINWKVRFKNPTFWAGVIVAILLPIFAYTGVSWEEITSWAKLGTVLFAAIKNPVIFVAIIVSVYNAVIDPTTKGLSDSANALGYTKPK